MINENAKASLINRFGFSREELHAKSDEEIIDLYKEYSVEFLHKYIDALDVYDDKLFEQGNKKDYDIDDLVKQISMTIDNVDKLTTLFKRLLITVSFNVIVVAIKRCDIDNDTKSLLYDVLQEADKYYLDFMHSSVIEMAQKLPPKDKFSFIERISASKKNFPDSFHKKAVNTLDFLKNDDNIKKIHKVCALKDMIVDNYFPKLKAEEYIGYYESQDNKRNLAQKIIKLDSSYNIDELISYSFKDLCSLEEMIYHKKYVVAKSEKQVELYCGLFKDAIYLNSNADFLNVANKILVDDLMIDEYKKDIMEFVNHISPAFAERLRLIFKKKDNELLYS